MKECFLSMGKKLTFPRQSFAKTLTEAYGKLKSPAVADQTHHIPDPIEYCRAAGAMEQMFCNLPLQLRKDLVVDIL